MYKAIWTAVVGEELICRREPTNSADRCVVAVLKEETIIGHLQRKMSKLCSLFLRRGGSMCCRVTGSRQYLSENISCLILFVYFCVLLYLRKLFLDAVLHCKDENIFVPKKIADYGKSLLNLNCDGNKVLLLASRQCATGSHSRKSVTVKHLNELKGKLVISFCACLTSPLCKVAGTKHDC